MVLKEVAKELKDSLRKIDLLARFGGEEFVLLLDATDAENAKRKAESLRARIAELDFHAESGRHFNVHISLGLALFPEDGRQQDELIEKADVALYNSKKAGRKPRHALPGSVVPRSRMPRRAYSRSRAVSSQDAKPDNKASDVDGGEE